MTTFQIIEAKPWHCGQMTRLLCPRHAQAAADAGADMHRELRSRFEQSAFRRAWLINGDLAALGGVTGSKISAGGIVWLALAERALYFRVAMVREARKQLTEIMRTKRQLCAAIVAGDDVSMRFAAFLGFEPNQKIEQFVLMDYRESA
jgi:hypothetical protein